MSQDRSYLPIFAPDERLTQKSIEALYEIKSLMEADPGLPVKEPTSAFWQSPPHAFSDVRSDKLPTTAATVVIGSGITACSVVKKLLETDAHSDIVVLEARELTSGATGRNGGHLVSSAVRDFSILQRAFGTEMAVKVAAFTLQNVERVFEVAKEHGPDVEDACEIRRLDKVLGAYDDAALEDLEKSLEAFEQHMPEKWKGEVRLFDKAYLEEKYKLRGIKGGGVGKGGALWPYRLITRVWSSLLEKYPKRLQIETSTPVTSVTSAPGGPKAQHPYIIATPRGTIRAQEVVYCTNGHTGHLIPRLRGKLFTVRGTMTVQDCGPSFPSDGGSRSLSFFGTGRFDPAAKTFDPGLHYMQQNAQTGDVFIGGETDSISAVLSSDDGEISPNSLQTLERILRAQFDEGTWGGAGWPIVKSKWSGIMGFTGDGVPLVGRLPDEATGRKEGGEWIAAGFNGYGMGNCWLCGEALAGIMRGEDVSGWLPECYRVSAKRLGSLSAETGASSLLGA